MFGISGISLAYDGIDIFSHISFIVNTKDRIGLVGKNGVGKSSLLKVILGRIQPSAGTIDVPSGKSVGYLAQEVDLNSSRSVMQETMRAFEEQNAIEAELEEITKSLEVRTDYQTDDYADTIDRLNFLHEKLALMDASKRESEVEKVLKGLGFKREEFDKSMDTFSGGWQMRVELAKLLLRTPDLLLMDEPTNHLDIESILWLEEYLKSYPGAVVMVSHDRMFLDNVTNRTIEIVNGKIYDYKVPYTKFTVLRQERVDQQQNAYANQQKHIEQQERFINRFRAQATKAKAVQSRIKQLEKIDKIEIDDLSNEAIRFKFPPAPRSGEVVVKAEDLSMAYGAKQVLNKLNFNILRGEKVAFVGKNGMGKTTLVKLINGMQQSAGEVQLGHNVSLNYYAQIQEKSLNPEATVIKTIEEIATDEMAKPHRIRALLGAFLFGENDIDKKVKVLSGGEKSRLALAKMMLSESNLLILDEPTNHLDMSAKEVLKNALRDFDGTLILVSHDREFLSGLTDKTFEFIDGRIKEHFGSIEEFLQKKQLENFRQFEAEGAAKKTASPQVNSPKNNAFKETKEHQKKVKSLKQNIKQLETEIAKIENDLKALEEQMLQAADNLEIFEKHKQLNEKLNNCLEKWEQEQESLDALEESAN